MFGDDLARKVEWNKGGDLYELVGKSVRIRFVLNDADIFAIEFVD